MKVLATVPSGRMSEFKPPHPERTAYKNASGYLNFDIIFVEFPNRASMLKAIEMQGKREYRNTDLKAYIK